MKYTLENVLKRIYDESIYSVYYTQCSASNELKYYYTTTHFKNKNYIQLLDINIVRFKYLFIFMLYILENVAI